MSDNFIELHSAVLEELWIKGCSPLDDKWQSQYFALGNPKSCLDEKISGAQLHQVITNLWKFHGI